MDKSFKIETKKGPVTSKVICDLSVDGQDVCKCKISVNERICSWNISSWFTESEFLNKGFGKETLKEALTYCINRYGNPAAIEYTWNGTNTYVLDWLTHHFDAVCTCPIAVQKNNADDDWDSHIYELNKEKVLEYFELLQERV